MISTSRIVTSPQRSCAAGSVGYSMIVIAATKSDGLRSRSQRPEGLRSGGQRDQVRSPNQEVLSHGART